MRLVRHGRRTQRRAGSQTRWSRGYTAWHGSAGRLSVCRRRTAVSLRHSLSIHRSICPSLFIVREQLCIYTYKYIFIVLFVFFLRLCHLSRSFTHTLTHAREFSNKEVYILLYVYDLTNLSSHTHIIYDRNLGASRKEKRIYTRKKEEKEINVRHTKDTNVASFPPGKKT